MKRNIERAHPMAARVEQEMRDRLGREPELLVRAPGRVNILGGHVDYSEGWVLPGAIEQSLWLAVATRPDREWQIRAVDLNDQRTLDLSRLPGPLEERKATAATGAESPQMEWIDYPAGVAWVLSGGSETCHFDLELPGLDVVMASELPMGGGVSSSAAVEMAFVLAVEHVFGRSDPAFAIAGVDKARIGRAVENEYLGVQSGIMDQYASIHGRPDTLLLLDCRELTHRELPLRPDVRVLVCDSRIRRRLVGSDFNSRRSQCEQAVSILQQTRPEIRTLRDVSVEELDTLVDTLPDPLDRRARHAIEEMARVLEGGAALERGDLETLGDAMKRSHRSSRDLYQVTLPELDHLAEIAWATDGCYGARLAGGGFGGCVLCLVHRDGVERLRERLERGYRERFGREPGFLDTAIAAGAELLD